MLYVLFSTTDSVGSKLIRQASGEPVSHTAILYNGMVWESVFPQGVRSIPFREWSKKNYIIASEPWPKSVRHPDKKDLEKGKGTWYDVGALLFLGVCFVLRVKPSSNLWNHPSAKICTEYVTKLVLGKEDHTVTPWQLRSILRERNTTFEPPKET